MPQSLSKVYVHITFSTKHRAPLIDKDIEAELHRYIGGICRNLKCTALQVGGYTEHIHILAVLHKSITQIKLLEELKKRSSAWIKTKDPKYANFYWQDGYGIFSVNPSEIDIVKNYIINQEEHHNKKSFKEELLAFLNKYKIDYNSQYLWD